MRNTIEFAIKSSKYEVMQELIFKWMYHDLPDEAFLDGMNTIVLLKQYDFLCYLEERLKKEMEEKFNESSI